jgi:branched-chain amino acid transport system permease protein
LTQAISILIGGLLQGGVFGLVAIGFALVYRVTGAINLAQGAFVVLGALLLYSFQSTFGWPLPLAVLAALAIALIVGAITSFVFAAGLRRLPASGMVMLTAGLLTLFTGLMLLVWGSQPYQLAPWSGYAPIRIGDVRIPTQAFWEFAITLVLVVALWYVLTRTTLGKALRACSENRYAASLMGIDVGRMTIISYMMGVALGAVGGMVFGPVVSLQFDGGSFFTTAGFIAVAIGGFGSFFGALFGGLGLGTVEQFAAGYVSSVFSTTIALLLLLVALIWRPEGIFGRRSTRREDVREAVPHLVGTRVSLDRNSVRLLGAIAILVIAVLPALVGSGFLNSLVITGIIFISVLGLDVLMGYAGQVSLGHAAFMAIGGYGAAYMTAKMGWPPLLGLLAGLVLTLPAAALLSLVTVKLRGHYMALATLAFGLLIDSLTTGMTGVTGGPSGFSGIPHLAIGSWSLDTPLANYYFIWGLAIVAVILLRNALRSDFGRALRAIRSDPIAARALGINVPRYKLYAFLISAGFASVAGSLYAFFFQFLSPEMVGMDQSFALITMLVVGGEGTLAGVVSGVFLLTMLPIAFQALATYKTLASGALLVIALMFLPSGISGAIVRVLRRITPWQKKSGTALAAARSES